MLINERPNYRCFTVSTSIIIFIIFAEQVPNFDVIDYGELSQSNSIFRFFFFFFWPWTFRVLFFFQLSKKVIWEHEIIALPLGFSTVFVFNLMEADLKLVGYTISGSRLLLLLSIKIWLSFSKIDESHRTIRTKTPSRANKQNHQKENTIATPYPLQKKKTIRQANNQESHKPKKNHPQFKIKEISL